MAFLDWFEQDAMETEQKQQEKEPKEQQAEALPSKESKQHCGQIRH